MRPPGYPRKRPVDWAFIRHCLSYRRFEKRAIADGYLKLDPTGKASFELFDLIRQKQHRITEVRVNPQGNMLYLRVEP